MFFMLLLLLFPLRLLYHYVIYFVKLVYFNFIFPDIQGIFDEYITELNNHCIYKQLYEYV